MKNNKTKKKFQPVVMTGLREDEFKDLHLLAGLRGDTISSIVTNCIRKELKFHSIMLEQIKTTSPQLVEDILENRPRKGHAKTENEQNSAPSLIQDLTLIPS